MSQAWRFVNMTKGEYLEPSAFGDGVQVSAFGSNSDRTMLGLAMLMADPAANGAGYGDFARSLSRRIGDNGELLEESSDSDGPWEPRNIENIRTANRSVSGDWQHRTIVPAIVGRWHGDDIRLLGEYSADSYLLEQAMKLSTRNYLFSLSTRFPEISARDRVNHEVNHNARMQTWLNQRRKEGCPTPSVYAFAREFFLDISPVVLEGMECLDISPLAPTESNFAADLERFRSIFVQNSRLLTGIAWLPVNELKYMLESVLRNYNEEYFRAFKSWIQRHKDLTSEQQTELLHWTVKGRRDQIPERKPRKTKPRKPKQPTTKRSRGLIFEDPNVRTTDL